MAGADGVTVAGFAQRLGPRLAVLGELLSSGEYRAQPVRLVKVERGGKTRERGVPTVADRIVQRAFLQVHGDVLQAARSETSFAYQRGRSWVDALRQARRHGAAGLRCVFRTDIQDFFHTVEHDALLAMLGKSLRDPGLTELVRGWIAAPLLTGSGLRERTRGIPEGAPVSPVLANRYLRDVDTAVDGRFGRLVRYADDLALFCRDRDASIAGAEHLLLELAALGLSVNTDKTYFGDFDAGFRMLGWVFQGDNGWPEQERDNWTHPLSGGSR